MAIVIGDMKAVDCGIAISTSNTVNLQVGSLETTRCGMGMYIRDDINNDLINLLSRVERLELNNKSEEILRSEVTTLINNQMKSPSAIEELMASFRNIFEGATGSLVYAAFNAWAITHGLS